MKMADNKQGSSEISNEKPKRKHKQSLGRQCAAYGCDNRTFKDEGGNRITSKISFFTFPDNTNRVKYWCSRIKRVNGKDNFKVTKTTVLCEKHFRPEDVYRPPGGTKKRLLNKETVIPYFTEEEALEASSTNTTNSTKRKAPVSRSSPRKKFRESQEPFPAFPEPQQDPVAEPEEEESIDWKAKYHELLQEHNLLKQQSKLSQSLKYRFIDNVMGSDKMCKHYTAFPTVEILKSVFFSLNSGHMGENIILYNNQSVKGLSAAGRPRNLSAFESFLLTVVRLRRNFDVEHLSFLFDISEGTVSNTVITWINFMYAQFGSICIWPTRAQVDAAMPKSCKEKFPKTRVIIDGVEFKVAVPSSLINHKMMWSDYKSHTTVKVLVGIAPGGGFTFISAAFPGSISDKNIVIKSGLLYPELWEKGDAIMADRGFTIDDYLKPIGVDLIIPSFLKGRQQLDADEVVRTQQIACERIHVERMIQRLKCFHIFDRVIPVNMLGSLNQMISVCGFLCNFQEPILKSS